MNRQQFIDEIMIGRLGFKRNPKNLHFLYKDDSFIETYHIVEGDQLEYFRVNVKKSESQFHEVLSCISNNPTAVELFVEKFEALWPEYKQYNTQYLNRVKRNREYAEWFAGIPSTILQPANQLLGELTYHKVKSPFDYSGLKQETTLKIKAAQMVLIRNEISVVVDRKNKLVMLDFNPIILSGHSSTLITSNPQDVERIKTRFSDLLETADDIRELLTQIELRLFVF